MPNWAYSRITTRTDEDFEKIYSLMKGDESENSQPDFDFNKIIPMPEEIRNTVAPNDIKDAWYFLVKEDEALDEITEEVLQQRIVDYAETLGISRNTFRNQKADLVAKLTKDIIREKQLLDLVNNGKKNFERSLNNKFPISKPYKATIEELGEQMLSNALKHGATNWYDWAIMNWDTKWNASDTTWYPESNQIYFQTAWSPSEKIVIALAKKLGIDLHLAFAEEQVTAFAGEMIITKDGEVHSYEPITEEEIFDTYIAVKYGGLKDYMRWNPKAQTPQYSEDTIDDWYYDEKDYMSFDELNSDEVGFHLMDDFISKSW